MHSLFHSGYRGKNEEVFTQGLTMFLANWFKLSWYYPFNNVVDLFFADEDKKEGNEESKDLFHWDVLYHIQNKISHEHSGILKNFHVCSGPKVTYIPPTLPEDEDSIFAHYETGINFDKYDDILVEVSGSNPPQAILVRKQTNHNTIYCIFWTIRHTGILPATPEHKPHVSRLISTSY